VGKEIYEEIQSLLDGSIVTVKKIVENTQKSVTNLINEGKLKVDEGNRVAKSCEDILQKIEDSTTHIANSMNSIEASSEEQTQGFLEISDSIHEVISSVERSADISKIVSGHTNDVETNIRELEQLIRSLEKQITGED
jgi:methyl-accepting chemotaxis protein